MLPLTELHGALQVAHGWQMLHSSDPSICRIARQQLRQIADSRFKIDAVGHLHRFGLKFEQSPAVEETNTTAQRLQLRVPHRAEWLDNRDVLRHVKLHLKNKHWTRPRGMWESDYRFAIAARLNQLDTFSVLKRRRLRVHDKCRHPGC
ncbi:unnamed protein product [Hyaloperonospora brassicae]|uniref:RxLR effector candidate protein n=1 Tax=Hyaloperonospora brassicae TaxID=162125 RepID=A0AAV0V133_HYABA|nr:unnamed protein product [Hyaloperonospora brassicae]